MCSDLAGASSSGSGIYLSFQIGQIARTSTISSTIRTTGHHLGFEREQLPYCLSGVLRHHA